jgi:transposase
MAIAGAGLGCRQPTPDFNPIEQAFSKLKTHLRRANQRTIEGLWVAIGHGLDQITANDEPRSYSTPSA